MLFAGIAWSADGFAVAFRDEAGAVPDDPPGFTARASGELVGRLVELDAAVGHQLVCVIDSTQGMVDGGLLRHGVRVHRADPWLLPSRPGFGSVDADALALTGTSRLADLPRLVLTEGSLTGREIDEDDGTDEAEVAPEDTPSKARRWARLESTAGNAVALTFDDGPNPPATDPILDVLERYGVPATFFCVGLQARAHPEQLARMAAAGHAIGNHTWSHPLLSDLTPAETAAQVERAGEAIARGTGGEPPRLFRPPYGADRPDRLRASSGAGIDTVLWDVDTGDWAMPGSDAIARSVLTRARPGSVVLMHDGGGDRSQTVAALPALIEGLLERGFALVSLRPH